MIYFDNGASSHPKPRSVIRAMTEWIQKNGANSGRSGHRLSMAAAEMVYNLRVALGELFGIDNPENVVLVPNATYALNTVLLGCFEKGDHIITTDLEHNSVLRPLWHLQSRGVEVSVVPIDFENDGKIVMDILSAIRRNTKAIVCTQCSNISGRMLPIKDLAERKPKDILLVVDGAQGAGSMPIHLKEWGVDYYCAPSHKGLLGPQGGGVLFVNNHPPRPLVFGGTGSESLNPEQPKGLPELLESGTLPTPICAGMAAAAEYLKETSIETIYSEKKKLTEYAYSKLKEVSGIRLYMEDFRQNCIGVIPFNMNNLNSAKVVEYLDQHGICSRGGLHCAPLFHRRMGTIEQGMVRISFGFKNNEYEIDHLIKVLKKL